MRDPLIAGILSFLIPGLGQIYNGQILWGLLWLVLTGFSWIGSAGLLGWVALAALVGLAALGWRSWWRRTVPRERTALVVPGTLPANAATPARSTR